MKHLKPAALFILGGLCYVGLELLWRGRSHVTMFLLSGCCFLLIGALGKLPPAVQMLLGAAVCTAGELLFGLAFNRGYGIWDYRSLPLNFRGQICLVYSMLWVPVSLAAGVLYRGAEKLLGKVLPA